MKVAIVSQWFPPETVPIPFDIASGLAERGHEVTVLTGFPNYPAGKTYRGWRQRPWADADEYGYHIRRVALYPSHDASLIRRAASYLSFALTSTLFGWRILRAADVVYVYHPPLTSAIGPWLSRLLRGAPYVLHIQDLWPDSVLEAGMMSSGVARQARALLTHFCGIIYRTASVLICIAPTMSRILHDRDVPAAKLDVLLNWADEDVFHPTEADDPFLSRNGLDGLFTVMFAGNIGHLQGLDSAIQAAATMRDVGNFRLVLVGDGVALPGLEELAQSLHTESVVFLPPQPHSAMNGVTRSADVQFVSLRDLPFFEGTIPSKLGAVMASGLPVICAVNGDAQRVVSAAGAGWTCPAEDVNAIAHAFRSAHASTSAKRKEYGAAGRSYYKMHMGREMAVNRLDTVLRRAADSEQAIQ